MRKLLFGAMSLLGLGGAPRKAVAQKAKAAEKSKAAARPRRQWFPGPADEMTRQRKRAELFRSSMRDVDESNVQRDRFERPRLDEGGSPKFDLSRKERRSLARAYAAGKWRNQASRDIKAEVDASMRKRKAETAHA